MAFERRLIESGLIDAQQLVEARRHQKLTGASLAASLESLGFVDRAELESLIQLAPPAPDSVEETGLDPKFLLHFVLKTMFVHALETPTAISRHTHLTRYVVELLLDVAKEKQLVEVLGRTESPPIVYRYDLTEMGRHWALESLEQCQYTGPAPVTVDAYHEQVTMRSMLWEQIGRDALEQAVSHLVLPGGIVERLGPALNAGRAILLYGAPGNGKTSIAEALSGALQESLLVPHCVAVDGQIVRFFDPTVHEPVDEGGEEVDDLGYEDPASDPRWVRCRRPVVIVGGELTMEMLDLSWDPVSKVYEAPMHIKALGGAFIIDDFGRQRVNPQELLNRWILPLERRIDFLTLHTGKKLRVPFDEMVVFSTNFPPRDLMDDAGLRRIPYKFQIPPPTPEDYCEIFRRLCTAHGLDLSEEALLYLLDDFYVNSGVPLSAAHPKLLIEAVVDRCRFDDVPPAITRDRLEEAVESLVIRDSGDASCGQQLLGAPSDLLKSPFGIR